MERSKTYKALDFIVGNVDGYSQSLGYYTEVLVLPIKGDYIKVKVPDHVLERFFKDSDYYEDWKQQPYTDEDGIPINDTWLFFKTHGPIDELLMLYFDIELIKQP